MTNKNREREKKTFKNNIMYYKKRSKLVELKYYLDNSSLNKQYSKRKT